jgi:hypothetical protein
MIVLVCLVGAVAVAIVQSQLKRSAQRYLDPLAPKERGTVGDGPGKYKVYGVDRSTKMDTSWVCEAESRANAAAKGRLEGIEVTALEKLP